MEGLFNREFDYTQFGSNIERCLLGRTVYVCTVRQPAISDLPIGDVFWLLKAAQAHRKGASVVVTDFYDKPGGENTAILNLMRILKLTKWENDSVFEDGVILRKAEDVPRNIQAWERFCDYVRSHEGERSEWKFAGNTGEGTDAVIQGEDYDVPKNMERFLEELSVWVDSIDGDAVQLLNHEKETTEWVRRTYPEAQKEFWRVVLPFINEFRGKYRTAEETGEMQIFERRIKDWAEKLAPYPDESQPEEQTAFYKHLFEELVQFLRGSFKYSTDRLVAKRIFDIDPKLLPFFIETCDENDATLATHDLFGGGGQVAAEIFAQKKYIDGLSIIGSRVLKQEHPDLSVLYKASLTVNVLSEGINHPFFTVLLMSDKIDINELAKFWLFMMEHQGDRARFLTHPIAGKIAESKELNPDLWTSLKKRYAEILKKPKRIINPLSVPTVKRVLNELLTENPDSLFQVILYKMFYLEQALDMNDKVAIDFTTKDDLIFLEHIAAQYIESGAQMFQSEALKLLKNIAKIRKIKKGKRKKERNI